MGKHDAYLDGYNAGLDRALRICQNDGIDELRKEVEYRGQTGFRASITRKDIEKEDLRIKANAAWVGICISLAAVKDELSLPGYQTDKLVERYIDYTKRCIEDSEFMVELATKANMMGIEKEDLLNEL